MSTITRIRAAIAIVIIALTIGGLATMFLPEELNLLSSLAVGSGASQDPDDHGGVTHWMLKVREGIDVTYETYPFIQYGADWMAFGWFVVALFLVLPYRNPTRYLGVIKVGAAACILIVPLSLICGQMRDIPVLVRIIDSMFGLVCLVPLVYAIRKTRELDQSAQGIAPGQGR